MRSSRRRVSCARIVGLTAALVFGALAETQASPQPSTCYGEVNSGRLEQGLRLPLDGSNFSAYSTLGWAAQRTYVHSRVHAVLLRAFAQLERTAPGHHFVYAETGWPGGGRFRPHKTHQNGLSVDLMVPVRRAGKPAKLPLAIWNRFGYALEFDRSGKLDDLQIDWEAMALWLRALHRAAAEEGVGIAKVVFDPALQPRLLAAPSGRGLDALLSFTKRPAWVRHDEHFHVDFAVPCRPLG